MRILNRRPKEITEKIRVLIEFIFFGRLKTFLPFAISDVYATYTEDGTLIIVLNNDQRFSLIVTDITKEQTELTFPDG